MLHWTQEEDPDSQEVPVGPHQAIGFGRHQAEVHRYQVPHNFAITEILHKYTVFSDCILSHNTSLGR